MVFEVNRKSISQQLVEHFVQQIESGEYMPGDEFPSERALEQQLGISRKTINKVVSVLAGMGYLFKEQGRTTYVADFRNAPRTASGERNFGIMFASPDNVYHPALSAVFTAMCKTLKTAEYGINLLFFGNVSKENLRRQIQNNPISGCFLFNGGEDISPLIPVMNGIPVVTLCSDNEGEGKCFSAVAPDVVSACGNAVEKFFRAGRKKIAFIYGKKGDISTKDVSQNSKKYYRTTAVRRKKLSFSPLIMKEKKASGRLRIYCPFHPMPSWPQMIWSHSGSSKNSNSAISVSRRRSPLSVSTT